MPVYKHSSRKWYKSWFSGTKKKNNNNNNSKQREKQNNVVMYVCCLFYLEFYNLQQLLFLFTVAAEFMFLFPFSNQMLCNANTTRKEIRNKHSLFISCHKKPDPFTPRFASHWRLEEEESLDQSETASVLKESQATRLLTPWINYST